MLLLLYCNCYVVYVVMSNSYIGLEYTCMATILDASVMEDLLCEPNVTAGQMAVTTNNVTPDIDFRIRIVASNSRDSAEIIMEQVKFFCVPYSTYYT